MNKQKAKAIARKLMEIVADAIDENIDMGRIPPDDFKDAYIVFGTIAIVANKIRDKAYEGVPSGKD